MAAKKQTPSEYLIGKNWRIIGKQGSIKYWDHPSHQSDTRGAFTTTDAAEHQLAVDKNGWCDCIKQVWKI